MVMLYIAQKESLSKIYDIRSIDLNNCITSDELFQAFKSSLEFDDGFGNNWDAFHDSILNLCFVVKYGLKLVISHGDILNKLSTIETEYILSDLCDMVRGLATQDDGKAINVCIQIECDSMSNAIILRNEFLLRLPKAGYIVSLFSEG